MGQTDQQAWTHQMIKSESDTDLAAQQQQANKEEIRSRMLTKKQLSDMAWGVRELSRRLSSVRIKFRVKSIFLLTKIYDLDLIPKTREITKWLLSKDRDIPYVVYVQDKFRNSKKFGSDSLLDELAKEYAEQDGEVTIEAARDAVSKRLRFWDEEMCKTRPHMFDFVITLGGDGTVLYASWLFQRIVPPVLSFALGSLGFLTKFDFDEFRPTLDAAFNRGVTVSLRLRFESTIMRSIHGRKDSDSEEEGVKRDLVEELIGEEKEDFHTHRPDGTFEILNEVVVDRGPNPSKSHFNIFFY